MKKTKGSLLFALLAAACFGTELLWRLAGFARDAIEYESRPSFLLVLIWLMLAAMIVTLAVRTRVGVLACAAAFAVLQAYWMIEWFEFEGVWDLLGVLAYSSLIALLILSLKNVRAVKFLWFIPAILLTLGNLYGWIKFDYFTDLSFVWKWMLFYHIAEMTGILFAGLWVKSTVAARDSAAGTVTCPGCGVVNPPGRAFCGKCGSPLPRWNGADPFVPPTHTAGVVVTKTAEKNYWQSPVPPTPQARCGRCGGQNTAGSAYCRYCGSPLPPAGPDTADWVAPLG